MAPNWIERKRKREQRGEEVKWGSPFKLVFIEATNGNGILF